MKPYSALTLNQRAQVTLLFADDLFGSDVTAYLYEVDKDGDITGRVRRGAHTANVNSGIMTRAAFVTDAQIQTARMHMDALAASAARNVNHFEEVPA